MLLRKFYSEKKISLVEPSINIYDSYAQKSKNCLLSAKILHKEQLYENSVSQSYFAMYNQALAILFACGIKSENHTATILLIEKVLELPSLSAIIHDAKKERIDKQYYVTTEASEPLTKEISYELIQSAELFSNSLRNVFDELTEEKREEIRKKFRDIVQK